MTTTTLGHLLAAVLASPEDDLPRLVMADRLDEEAGHVECPSIRPDGPCDTVCQCRGTGTVPNGKAERAAIIRLGVADPRPTIYPEGAAASVVWSWGWDSPPCEVQIAQAIPNVSFTVSRGFVSEVRAPLATLVGGECGRCRIHETIIRDHGQTTSGYRHLTGCPACSGTGRAVGILRDVLKCQPVTRVVVTDREPWESTEGLEFHWYNDDRERHVTETIHFPSDLPGGIFELLEGWKRQTPGVSKCFPTRELADAALSAALLKWGHP